MVISSDSEPVLPEYDISKEKPLTHDYYKVRSNAKISKTIREAREFIIEIIISKPFLIILGIIVFSLAIIPYKKFKKNSNIKLNR